MLASTQTKLDIAVTASLIILIIVTVLWQVGKFQRGGEYEGPNLVVFALIMTFVFIVVARHLLYKLLCAISNSIIWNYIALQKRRREAFELKLKRYGQLDSSKQEIRLLTIAPGLESDPVVCTLRTAFIGAEDCDYEALSYTWGSALNAREILLDGIPFSVTRNLHNALKHLRQAEDARTFWIDAVCINQFRMDERSQQVAFMRHIYQCASSVVIWLGPASGDSDLAFNFMAQDNSDEIVCNSIGNLDYIREWRAIRRLFTREYWNRVWIIQEVAMSISPTVQCGTRKTEWGTVVRYDNIWQTQRRLKLSTHGHFFETIDRSDQGPLRAFRRTAGPYLLDSTRREVTGRRKGRVDENANVSSPNTLLDLIQSHWMANATDPRDQIFALFGLSSDREALEELGFRVDYELELSDVYRMLVHVLFKKTGRIDIIGFAGISDQDEESQLSKKIQAISSWIPTWSSNIPSKLHLAQINMTRRYNAGGTTNAVVEFDDGMLTITGRVVASIWKLGPRSSNYRTSTFTDSDLKNVSKDIRAYHSFAAKMVHNIQHFGSERQRDHLLTNLDEFWRVLVCDRTVDGFESPNDWSHQFRAIVFGPMELPEEITSAPNFDVNAFIRPYQEAVLYTMSSRRLFVTHDGNFGVGPSDLAAEKDEIVIFLGCNVPMVVRKVWTLPSRTERRTYRLPDEDYLKGYAFLQNHMESNLADMLDDDDSQQSDYGIGGEDVPGTGDSEPLRRSDSLDSRQLLGIARTKWTF